MIKSRRQTSTEREAARKAWQEAKEKMMSWTTTVEKQAADEQDKAFEEVILAGRTYAVNVDNGTVTKTVEHLPANKNFIDTIVLASKTDKSLLDALRNHWRSITDECFHEVLTRIGYPEPLPSIKNVTKLEYYDNILEIIQGEKDDYNPDIVPGHGVHELRPEESSPSLGNYKKPERRNHYTPSRSVPKQKVSGIVEQLNSGPQHQDRPSSPDPFNGDYMQYYGASIP